MVSEFFRHSGNLLCRYPAQTTVVCKRMLLSLAFQKSKACSKANGFARQSLQGHLSVKIAENRFLRGNRPSPNQNDPFAFLS